MFCFAGDVLRKLFLTLIILALAPQVNASNLSEFKKFSPMGFALGDKYECVSLLYLTAGFRDKVGASDTMTLAEYQENEPVKFQFQISGKNQIKFSVSYPLPEARRKYVFDAGMNSLHGVSFSLGQSFGNIRKIGFDRIGFRAFQLNIKNTALLNATCDKI